MADHGTRSRYNAGCRCERCVGAQRAYDRARADKRRGLQVVSAPQAPAPAVAATTPAVEPADGVPAAPTGPGDVELGVRARIEMLSTAEKRPDLVAICVALARVMDTPQAMPQHSAASHRLRETLHELSIGAEQPRSRLGAVREMSKRGAG